MTETNGERLILTEQQQEYAASRILHDAQLIKYGAIITEHGALQPTSEQIHQLYRQDVLDPQMEEFMGTREGSQIELAKDEVHMFENLMHGKLGHCVIPGRLTPKTTSMPKAWAEANGLDIDTGRLDQEFSQHGWDQKEDSYHSEVLDELRGYMRALDDLTYDLIAHPQLRLGSTVTVMRNGKDGAPNYTEGGWKIVRICANGQLSVASPDNLTDKFYPAGDLAALNQ